MSEAYMQLEDPLILIEANVALLNKALDDHDDRAGAGVTYLVSRLEEHVAELRQMFNDGIGKDGAT